MKATISIKIDKEVKEKAQKIAKEIGLSLNAVVNAYLKEFVRDKALHIALKSLARAEREKEIYEWTKKFITRYRKGLEALAKK